MKWSFLADTEWGWNHSAHTHPHLPISAATLMQILKRAKLAGRLCIAMEMQTGSNPFFIDRRCQLGYSECSACDIKRKESQGGNQTHSDGCKSQTETGEVLDPAVSWLSAGLSGSQYVVGGSKSSHIQTRVAQTNTETNTDTDADVCFYVITDLFIDLS